MGAVNPSQVKPGDAIRADNHNLVVEQLRKQQLVSMDGFTLLQTSGGVAGRRITQAQRRPDGGVPDFPVSLSPWEVFQWTPAAPAEAACTYTYWRNVRVHLGYVNDKTTTAAKKVHELDPNLPTGSNAGSDYDILVPASTTAYKIWGKVTYTRQVACSTQEASVTISAVIIEHGEDWWTDHPSQYPAAGTFYFEIGTVTTTADQLPYTDCPTNTVPNGSYPPVLSITQIADSDQRIVPWTSLDVTLATDGGSAGSATTAGDYTYTATDCCGIVVGAELVPVHSVARFIGAQITAASIGVVRLNCSGEVVLWDSNEKPGVHDCDA